MSVSEALADRSLARGLALLAALVLLGSSLQVMYHLIDVVGVPLAFLALVAANLLLATLAARYVPAVVGVAVGVGLFAVGLVWYLGQLTSDPSLVSMLVDTLDLLAGRSLLGISAINDWVIGVSSAPVFLTWYFALRKRYAASVLVAGGTLSFFVLTTDANAATTLSGVVAGALALGFGDADRRADPILSTDALLVVVAAMIVVPGVISVVPASAAAPFGPSDLGDSTTVEASLVDVDQGVSVGGDIRLSPEVRYTVHSDRRDYWRVGSFGRYTGTGWVRTGDPDTYDGREFAGPPGDTERIVQTYEAESETDAMPAAWKPVSLRGHPARTLPGGGFEPARSIPEGESYTVTSAVPTGDRDDLREAGTDYPGSIGETYTQLPASTPDRVATRTDRITADAENPYETAVVVEQWLENNKNYSLDVDRPRGDIADGFLFERDAGYCTYFATTMVTMLRTQDVPARFVVGYTPGQRVDRDEYVVRGLDAHAWVEVFFPGRGWVRFDPTPAGPRQEVEQARIEQARENNATDVDVDASEGGAEWTPTPTATPAPLTTVPENGSDGPTTPTPTFTPPPGIVTGEIGNQSNFTATETTPAPGAGTGGDGLPTPTRREIGLALLALVGGVAGARRTNAVERAYRAVWLYYQPREDPAADVERAYQRLQHHLADQHDRERRPGETVREYLAAVDAGEKAARLAELRERARYRGDASRSEADEAVALANELVR